MLICWDLGSWIESGNDQKGATQRDDDPSKLTLSGTGLESGSGEERLGMVKGSEMEVTRKRKQMFSTARLCVRFLHAYALGPIAGFGGRYYIS